MSLVRPVAAPRPHRAARTTRRDPAPWPRARRRRRRPRCCFRPACSCLNGNAARWGAEGRPSSRVDGRRGRAGDGEEVLDAQLLAARLRIDAGRLEGLAWPRPTSRRARSTAPAAASCGAAGTRRRRARTSRRVPPRCRGSSPRSNPTSTESTFGTGQNTMRDTCPASAPRAVPGRLDARPAVDLRSGFGGETGPTSACTMTMPALQRWEVLEQVQQHRHRHVVRQVRDERARAPGQLVSRAWRRRARR